MSILKKIFGISHYPTFFEGYYIDYKNSRYQHTCGHASYPAYKFYQELNILVPQGLLYCPQCQVPFREPQMMNLGHLDFG